MATKEQKEALKETFGEEAVRDIQVADETTDKLVSVNTDTNAEGIVNPNPAEGQPPITVKPAPKLDEDIDDAKILLALQQKHGLNIQSLDELTTKVADPQKVAEDRESEKLSFGIKKGLFTTSQYNAFVRDSNDPKALVFSDFYTDAKLDDPSATDEQIKADFAEKYGLDANPATRRYIRGQNEINLLSEKLLRKGDKYGKIFSLDDEFAKHESSVQGQRESDRNITSQVPAYKKDVEEVFTVFTSENKYVVDLPNDGGSKYEVDLPAETVAALKEKFLESGFAASQIRSGWTKENLREIVNTALISQNFAHIVAEVNKQHLLKNQAGARGIVPASDGQTSKEAKPQYTPAQQEAFNHLFPGGIPKVTESGLLTENGLQKQT